MIRIVRTNALSRVAVGIGLVVALGSGAVAGASVHLLSTPSTAHGEYFQLKSQKDSTFCIDVDPQGTPGRSLFLSVCTAALSQRWTFTSNADGSNLLVNSQGFCVDAVGRTPGDGVALQVNHCNFAKSQRLHFTDAGNIQIGGTKNCLSYPRPGSGAAVFLQACGSLTALEEFKLAQ